MKINPIGIQSYQQLNRQDQPAAAPRPEPQPESTVSIDPKSQPPTSQLAVKASGANYLNALSGDERKALDLLFSKFRDTGRFGANYKPDGDNQREEGVLGRLIDVKV
jgi:hypothetical protein